MDDRVIDLDAAASRDSHQPLPDRAKPIRPPAGDDAPEVADPLTATAKSLKAVSDQIQRHEERHAAALRDVSPSSHPIYEYRHGPDGKFYVVAGEVLANLKPVKGLPHLSEARAEAVFRSALANEERSPEDLEAARKALHAAQQARQEKSARMIETGRLPASPVLARFQNFGPNKAIAIPQFAQASPNHDVSMRFGPAAAFAAARAVGGAIGRVATASARRVTGAGRAAAQYAAAAPSSRIGKLLARRNSSGAIVDSRAQMLARAFQGLEGAVHSSAKNFGELGDRLTHFSADLQVQRSLNQVNRFQQDIRQARELGPGLAEFEKQRGRIDIAGREVSGDVTKLLMPLATEANQTLAIISETVSNDLKWLFTKVGPLIEWLGKRWDDANQALEELNKQFKAFLGIKDNPAEVDPNLQRFFNMQIPMGNPLPVLQGQLNMPMFKMDVPQPFAPVGGI